MRLTTIWVARRTQNAGPVPGRRPVGQNALVEGAPVADVEIYELGERVGLAARFGSERGPVDPPGVVFRVRDPQGRITELAYGRSADVTRVGPGVYQAVVAATVAGRWRYRFAAAGRAPAHEGFFDVFDIGT